LSHWRVASIKPIAATGVPQINAASLAISSNFFLVESRESYIEKGLLTVLLHLQLMEHSQFLLMSDFLKN
jgi:hypothetical protein